MIMMVIISGLRNGVQGLRGFLEIPYDSRNMRYA